VEVASKPNARFKNYRDIFDNLLKTTNVTTLYPICSVAISYDSTRAITVTKRHEREYYVKMYDLESYELTFEEKIGGEAKDYIKLKEVEQDATGQAFAIVYFNDGNFFMRNFGRVSRTPEEIKLNEVNINELVGIDNWTMVYDGFPDPSITCTFVSSTKVFINCFYNPTLTHYHFIYDTHARKVEGQIISIVMNSNKKNFPYKCFYSDERNEIYSFYR
jgi:hypothetical protein